MGWSVDFEREPKKAVTFPFGQEKAEREYDQGLQN